MAVRPSKAFCVERKQYSLRSKMMTGGVRIGDLDNVWDEYILRLRATYRGAGGRDDVQEVIAQLMAIAVLEDEL